MGEEDFTPKELEILGEEPAPEPATPDPNAEPAPAPEPQPEPAPEPTPAPAAENMVPQSRFDEVYGKSKEAERKYNLIKELGLDEFYKRHPEERPANYAPQAKPVPAPVPVEEYGGLTYNNPGHQWHGLTLNQINEQDPIAAKGLLDKFVDGQNRAAQEAQREKEEQDRKFKEDSEKEVQTFSDARATELFGKKLSELPEADQQKVNAVVASTLEWMQSTNRGGGFIEDAFTLMNLEKIRESERTKGAEAALKSINKPAVPSIAAGKTGGNVVSSNLETMSTAELSAHIHGLPEAKMMEFLKSPPGGQALKDKHPTLPWD